MSRNLRILLLVAFLAAAGGGGWYFLMGPGAGGGEEEAFDLGPRTAAPDCPPGGSAGTGDPATGTGTATTPPATPDPAAGATTPPAGPPAGAPASGIEPVTRGGAGNGSVVAAVSGDHDPSATTDSPVVSAQGSDAIAETSPPAGAPVTPPAADAAATPPADPATTPPAGDAAATGAETGAAATGQPQAVDPCADTTTASPPGASGGTGAGAGLPDTGGAAAGGVAPGTGAEAAATTSSDGVNHGNNPEALTTAEAVVAIGKKSKLSFAVDTTLAPAAGGVQVGPAKLRRYRASVSTAVLRIRISDAASQDEWDKGSKVVRSTFVSSFLTFLKRTYPKATRSVTIVADDGRVLAVGDARPVGAGSVQIYG